MEAGNCPPGSEQCSRDETGGEGVDADPAVLDSVAPGLIGKIRTSSQDGRTTWFELRNGSFGSVTTADPIPFEPGDVVLVTEDHVIPAPDELWEVEPWIGVVRLKLSDITILDSGGKWHRVPTVTEPDYKVGNTVEARDLAGVVRVLHELPIKLIDTGDLDESVVNRFRTSPESVQESFDSLGGLDEVIERAKELIELPLQAPDKLKRIGARPIKGVLFTGPAGTGKTMLARIIAARSGATFYNINGPEIFSKWYGQSEEVLRLIFEDARKQPKSIIFFDEIDSVAGQREDAHEASRRVVAQLLTLMDGFEPDENLIVLATTNRPGDIDEALRRPGRLDWEIEFPYPSLEGRLDILQKSAHGKEAHPRLPFELVAAHSVGWSGAELVAIWTEAALLAVSDGRDQILGEDFLGGWERVAAQRTLQARTMKKDVQ